MVAIFFMIVSALLASVSQVLLKKSANKKYDSILSEYLNVYVLLGYGILLLTMLINIFAYQYLPYKIGPVLNTLSYIFVFAFSYIIFKEKMNTKKFIGVILILLGIIVFNL